MLLNSSSNQSTRPSSQQQAQQSLTHNQVSSPLLVQGLLMQKEGSRNPMEYLAQHFLANLNQYLVSKCHAVEEKVAEPDLSSMNQSSSSGDMSLPTSNSSASETSLSCLEVKSSDDHKATQNSNSTVNMMESVGVSQTLTMAKTNSPIFDNNNKRAISSMDDSSLDQNSDNDRKKIREEIKIQPSLSSAGVEFFSCPLCNESNITDRAKLTQHLQLHQSDQKRDDGKHICCFCFNELSSNSSLERHLLTHTNHRPFQCTHCDKAFTTNGNLSRHIKTSHQNVKIPTTTPTLSTISGQPLASISMAPQFDPSKQQQQQQQKQQPPPKLSDEIASISPRSSSPSTSLPQLPAEPELRGQPAIVPVFQPIPINNFLLNALNMLQMHQGAQKNFIPPILVPQMMLNQQQPIPIVSPIKHPEQNQQQQQQKKQHHPKSAPTIKSQRVIKKSDGFFKKYSFYRYFKCPRCKAAIWKRNRKLNKFTHKCLMNFSLHPSETIQRDYCKSRKQSTGNHDIMLRSNENHLSSSGQEVNQFRKKNSYKDAPRLISCPISGCKQKFPWNSSLKRHILTHTPHKPFACTRCNKSFSTKSNRERHMERVHKVSLKRQKKKVVDEKMENDQNVNNNNNNNDIKNLAKLYNQIKELAPTELTGEELISMDSNDKQAEDISNKLLQTAGYPKVEPNPGRFFNKQLNNEMDRVVGRGKKECDKLITIATPIATNFETIECTFCRTKVTSKNDLLIHIMNNHLAM